MLLPPDTGPAGTPQAGAGKGTGQRARRGNFPVGRLLAVALLLGNSLGGCGQMGPLDQPPAPTPAESSGADRR